MHGENGEVVLREDVERDDARRFRGSAEDAEFHGRIRRGSADENRGQPVPARDFAPPSGPDAESAYGSFGAREFRGEGRYEGEERHAEDVDVGDVGSGERNALRARDEGSVELLAAAGVVGLHDDAVAQREGREGDVEDGQAEEPRRGARKHHRRHDPALGALRNLLRYAVTLEGHAYASIPRSSDRPRRETPRRSRRRRAARRRSGRRAPP